MSRLFYTQSFCKLDKNSPNCHSHARGEMVVDEQACGEFSSNRCEDLTWQALFLSFSQRQVIMHVMTQKVVSPKYPTLGLMVWLFYARHVK